MMGIYRFVNKYTRKSYIGKSKDIEKRYYAHKIYYKKYDTIFYRAIKKYGWDSFDFQIVAQCPKEYLDYWEKFFIKYYCSNNRNYGYNMTEGGDGISFWDEDMRKKHSEIHKGQICPMKGKHHTEETKELLRRLSTGKKQSKETIEKRLETIRAKGIKINRKGFIPWNKGLTKEEDNRLGPNSGTWKKGNIPWNKGKTGYTCKKHGPMSDEVKKKISETKKRNNMKKREINDEN